MTTTRRSWGAGLGALPSIRLAFLALGVVLGSYLPFTTVLQSDKGFEPVAIGVLSAAASLMAVLAAPIWGHLGDVAIGRRAVLLVSSMGAIVTIVVFGIAAAPAVLVGSWVLFGITATAANPTVDAIAVTAVRQGGRGSFARLRALLSLAFGATAIATGLLYDAAGYGAVPFVAALAFVVLILVSRLLPDPPRADATLAVAGRRGGATSAAFAAQPRLPAALVTFGLGSVGIVTAFGYLPLRLAELGAAPSGVALAAGLESFAEVPAFVVAGAVAARLGLRVLFAMGAGLSAICLLALAMLDVPELMIGVRMLTGVAYAALAVATVSSLGLLLPASLQATGQSLAGMTLSVASILVGLAGGAIYQAAGASVLFILAGLLALVAAVVALLVLPGRDNGRAVPTGPGASSA